MTDSIQYFNRENPTEQEIKNNVFMVAKQIMQERYFTQIDFYKMKIAHMRDDERAIKALEDHPKYPSAEDTLDLARAIYDFVKNG